MTVIMLEIIAIPMLVLGIFMRKGKGLMLLAGYNTMSKEERDMIDKEKLGRMSGNLLIRMAVEFTLIGVAIQVGGGLLFLLAFALFMGDIVVSVYRINKNTATVVSKQSKAGIFALAGMCFVVVVLMSVMFVNGDKDPAIAFEDNAINIDCMYGVSIPANTVATIILTDNTMDELAPDARRTNGYGGFGDALKGNFRSDELGSFKMFVRTKSSPTICIGLKDGQNVYISLKNPDDTRAAFESISKFLDGV